MKKNRVDVYDYTKGVLIILMVLFHLQIIEELYPKVREATYMFHMAGFLVLSGYLSNVKKDIKVFSKSILKILVPYLIFETIYILLKLIYSGGGFSDFSTSIVFYKVLLSPDGPYWYLHTLTISLIIYYIISKAKINPAIMCIFIGCAFWGVSNIVPGFKWYNSVYFFLGAVISLKNRNIADVLSVTWVAIIPLAIILIVNREYVEGSLLAIATTYLVLSLLFYSCKSTPNIIKTIFLFLGRNTLLIVVFSPIFTVTSKLYLRFFVFDDSKITFAIFTLIYVIGASLLCGKLCDYLKISKILFSTDKVYSDFN